jgi:hypothetical protein
MGEVPVTSSDQTAAVIDTPLATNQKSKLRVLIGRMDGLAMILCALIGFDTFGKLTSEGAQAIAWRLFMGVVFCAPNWERRSPSRGNPTRG